MWPPAEDLVVHREAAAEREFGSRPELRLADDRWRRAKGVEPEAVVEAAAAAAIKEGK